MKADRPEHTEHRDLELVRRIKKGDTSAFSQLSELYMPLLCKRAGRYARIVDSDMEDFLQEGLLALYRAAMGFDGEAGARFSTYASACVQNSMIDAMRAVRRDTQKNIHVPIDDVDKGGMRTGGLFPHAGNPVEDMLLEHESMAVRARQIESLLSDFEQQVVKLYLRGHTYQEISAILSTAVKSVDNALQRVRRKLKPGS